MCVKKKNEENMIFFLSHFGRVAFKLSRTTLRLLFERAQGVGEQCGHFGFPFPLTILKGLKFLYDIQ